MAYVVYGMTGDDNDVDIIGVFDSESAAEHAKAMADNEWQRAVEWTKGEYRSTTFGVGRVPYLNVRGQVNYNWSPFRSAARIKWPPNNFEERETNGNQASSADEGQDARGNAA